MHILVYISLIVTHDTLGLGSKAPAKMLTTAIITAIRHTVANQFTCKQKKDRKSIHAICTLSSALNCIVGLFGSVGLLYLKISLRHGFYV